jgi:hypothetical protein
MTGTAAPVPNARRRVAGHTPASRLVRRRPGGHAAGSGPPPARAARSFPSRVPPLFPAAAAVSPATQSRDELLPQAPKEPPSPSRPAHDSDLARSTAPARKAEAAPAARDSDDSDAPGGIDVLSSPGPGRDGRPALLSSLPSPNKLELGGC